MLYTSDDPFFIILQLFIFFRLSHTILEVDLTRNIDIKNDGLKRPMGPKIKIYKCLEKKRKRGMSGEHKEKRKTYAEPGQ